MVPEGVAICYSFPHLSSHHLAVDVGAAVGKLPQSRVIVAPAFWQGALKRSPRKVESTREIISRGLYPEYIKSSHDSIVRKKLT